MTDVSLLAPTAEVQWDTLNWTDVTSIMLGLSAKHGSASRSNPDRPTILPANGQLLLSAEPTDAQKAGRFAVRFRIGSRVLWSGWLSAPQIVPGPRVVTRWKLTGLLAEHMQQEGSLNQAARSADDTFADSDLWMRLVSSTPQTAEVVDRDLKAIAYSQRTGGVVSRLAAVSGTDPVERRNGGLGFFGRVLNAVPSSFVEINNDDVLITKLDTDDRVDRIRNVVTTEAGSPAGASTPRIVEATATVDGIGQTRGSGQAIPIPELVVQLGELPAGSERLNLALVSAQAKVVVPTLLHHDRWQTSSVPGAAYIDFFELAIAPDLQRVLVDHNENPAVAMAADYLTATAEMTLPGDWGVGAEVIVGTRTRSLGHGWWLDDTSNARGITNGLGTGRWPLPADASEGGEPYIGQADTPVFFTSNPTILGLVTAVEVTYRLSFDERIAAAISPLVAVNQPSIATWGRRELQLPDWIALNSDLQSYIDALSSLRQEHTITVPLRQPTATASDTVQDLDAGDYVHLNLLDPSRNINISEYCLVLDRTLKWTPRSGLVAAFRCLETGHAPPPTGTLIWDRGQWDGGTWG